MRRLNTTRPAAVVLALFVGVAVGALLYLAVAGTRRDGPQPVDDSVYDERIMRLVEREVERRLLLRFETNHEVGGERRVDNSARKYPRVKRLSPVERKRILVTGGAGFVGSHLVDVLMQQGHEVVVVDNFYTGRRQNIEHWLGHPNFEVQNHDVTEPLFVQVNQIYHLASPASPPHYQYNPIKTIKTNAVGTLNMLGLARRVGARILLASTSEVYGDPEQHPQKETYWGHVNPIGPRACYDEGKRIAETMCYAYAQQEGVQVRVARIFNTFGPRMHPNDGRVVSNFIIQALRGDPITVYGTGKQTRSFQYVSDLVEGLVLLMNSNYTEPVNIGNPDEYTILQFAKMIQQIVSPSTPIKYLPAARDDPQKRQPDISRAKAILGWSPKMPLNTGLQRTIDYFKKELHFDTETQDAPDAPAPA